MNIYEQLTENCREDDCKIVKHGSISTLLAYEEAYDRYGNSLNKNPNTITTNYKCLKCNKFFIHHENESLNVNRITEISI